MRQATASRVGAVSDYVQSSFESFMATEYARVLAFARATVGSWPEAEDLTQEAFLVAYRRWEDVAEYERPDAFVRRVIANKQVSGVRRRVRESAALLRLRPVEVVEPDVGDPAFWDAVRRLPVRQRQVVALHYLDDRSVADIATVLAIAEGTVKAHLHAARHALATALGEDIDEEGS